MNTSRTQEQPLEQDLTAAWRYRRRPRPPRYDFAGVTMVCYLIFCIAGAVCWLWMALEPIFEAVEKMLR